MLKPRLCFALLYAHEKFHLSRNFKLQEVGDYDWLIDNYELDSMVRSIDELFILNVSRAERNWPVFLTTLSRVAKNCFMPIAVGGGISSIEHAKILFDNGADKIVINSILFEKPDLVNEIVRLYGSQSIVASIDFMRNEHGITRVLIHGGSVETHANLEEAVEIVARLGVGEILLNSIDRDGVGNGFDLQALEVAYKKCALPIIAAGGADTSDRLAEGILSGFATSVCTSHLFNFMCDGLSDARKEIVEKGIKLSNWNFKELI